MQKAKQNIHCKNCNSTNIVKRGFAKNKLQVMQKYKCKECSCIFTTEQITGKTYPTKIILNAISTYNLGNSLNKTAEKINIKHSLTITTKTISNWLNEYKYLCSFNKLRSKAIKLHKPNSLIFSQTFYHIQPYTFKYHKAKLYLLFHSIKYNNQFHNISKFYEPLKQYLEKITTKKFPHHIFKSYETKLKEGIIKASPDAAVANKNLINNENKINNNEQRASQLKLDTLKITKLQKNNFANKLANLALNLAKSNKERHQAIQNFMLINDSTTIAVEIPAYLTNDDIIYFKTRKFLIKFLENYSTPITGHIDIIQIRNGLIHILDYKPDAHLKQIQQQAIKQLTIYALALASRTKLALSDFKCAFFDENNYYEFFPLHAVYEKR